MRARLASWFPKSFWRYATVGIVSNASLYGLFVVLYWAGMPPPAAAAACYAIGLAVSYLMNRSWSFESRQGHGRDLPRFLLAYGLGFVATMVFIALLTRIMRPEFAQILNIGLTAIVIYSGLRIFGFGSAAQGEETTDANRTQ